MASLVPVAVGIDMGATHIRICLLSTQGDVLDVSKEKTLQVIEPGLCAGLAAFIDSHLAAHQASAAAIVIGFPASVSRDRRTVISTPNLPGNHEEFARVVDVLSEHFHCQVNLERDVNLQLYYDVSEHQLGERLVTASYLGTGFGFSVWLNGAPFTGAHGVAGEMGHIPYGDHGLHCGCGNLGCIETNCSGVALRRWYDSAPRDYALSDVFLHAQQDPDILAFIDGAARAIATGINLFDPDAAILGGGVMDMNGFPWELLVDRTKSYTRKPLPYEALIFVKASSSSFSGAIGGARLCLRELQQAQA